MIALAMAEMQRAKCNGMRSYGSSEIAGNASTKVFESSEYRFGICRISGPSVAKAMEPKKTMSANRRAKFRITPTTSAAEESVPTRRGREAITRFRELP